MVAIILLRASTNFENIHFGNYPIQVILARQRTGKTWRHSIHEGNITHDFPGPVWQCAGKELPRGIPMSPPLLCEVSQSQRSAGAQVMNFRLAAAQRSANREVRKCLRDSFDRHKVAALLAERHGKLLALQGGST